MIRTPGFSSRCLCTSSSARVMSASTVSWNAGTVHACVSRRAIVLRMLVSGRRSTSAETGAAATGTAAGAGPACARSTSSATIRPSGPVPLSWARSIPRSRAMRRASGDALMRPFTVVAAAGAATGAGAASATGSTAAGSGAAFTSAATSGTLSSFAPMKPIVRPTGTSPSVTAIFSRTPVASASTSCVTLSVSSS